MRINDYITNTEGRRNCPVGTVIQTPGRAARWTKEAPNCWTSDNRASRDDGGPGNGWFGDHGDPSDTDRSYRIVALPDGYVAPSEAAEVPQVGTFITSIAMWEALPMGSVATRDSNGVTATKQPDGRWLMQPGTYYSPADLRRDGVFVVTSLGDSTPAMDYQEFLDLPVGTMLQVNGGQSRWAVAPARMMTCETGGRVPMSTFRGMVQDGLVWLHAAAAETPVAEVAVPIVGQTITSQAQYDALPLGSWVRKVGDPVVRRQKTRLTEWYSPTRDNYRSTSMMRTDSFYVVESVGLPTAVPGVEVGTVITSRGQVDAMPTGSVLVGVEGSTTIRFVKEGSGRWVNQTTEHVMGSDAMRYDSWFTVLSIGPEVPVPEVPAEPMITMAEHERLLAVARETGRLNGASEKQQEVYDALREAWDGTSFNEDEINDVLDGLGMEPIAPVEVVRVTVTVTGRSVVESSEIHDAICGEFSVDIDGSTTVPWRLEGLDFEIEDVAVGDCACDQVGNYDVRARLDEGNMSYEYDSIDFESTCSNCT